MTPTPIHQANEGPPEAGSKRPAVSLLPAFEPLSSSPTLPRPPKRNRDALNEDVTYPTPVPTSSTAILTSSPPRIATGRPPIQRLHSTVSERAPLSDVPTIELNPNGKPVLMGRSSASCHYQLSSNRLISRVHVEATYRPASTSLERDRVEIVCTGWNGIKVHCLGKVYDLVKGKKFLSDAQDVDIMVDVQDARVLLKWPPMPRLGPISSDEKALPQNAREINDDIHRLLVLVLSEHVSGWCPQSRRLRQPKLHSYTHRPPIFRTLHQPNQ